MTAPAHRMVRELTKAIAGEREQRLFGFCVYCGRPCRGLACNGHRDLLHLDDHTYALRLREQS